LRIMCILCNIFLIIHVIDLKGCTTVKYREFTRTVYFVYFQKRCKFVVDKYPPLLRFTAVLINCYNKWVDWAIVFRNRRFNDNIFTIGKFLTLCISLAVRKNLFHRNAVTVF